MCVCVCVCWGRQRNFQKVTSSGESCPSARHGEAGLRSDTHFAEEQTDSKRLGNLSKATQEVAVLGEELREFCVCVCVCVCVYLYSQVTEGHAIFP